MQAERNDYFTTKNYEKNHFREINLKLANFDASFFDENNFV